MYLSMYCFALHWLECIHLSHGVCMYVGSACMLMLHTVNNTHAVIHVTGFGRR